MKATLQTLLEALLVIVVGTALALAGNALSPRGLKIDRRYITEIAPKPTPATQPGEEDRVNDGGETEPSRQPESADDKIVGGEHWEQVKEYGLEPIKFADAKEAYLSPEYEMGAIVFIDARKEDLYSKGHIPGAYLCDRYRIDEYVGDVYAATQAAFQVIVYCGGGDCEDSLQTVLMLQSDPSLIDQGYTFDPTKMFVFVGGLDQWVNRGGPIEKGERNSGDITGGFDE